VPVNIYTYESYDAFIRDWIQSHPREGFGLITKIAKHLKTHPSIISLVVRGEKHLTFDQAGDFCDFAELADSESEFFLTLFQIGRSSKPSLIRRLKRKIERMRDEQFHLENRIQSPEYIDESITQTFYSKWYYSGIKNLAALEGINTTSEIAKWLHLDEELVDEVVNFLLAHGICQKKDGQLSAGLQITHLTSKDPLVYRHHTNWRLKALDSLGSNDFSSDHRHITAPVSLSNEDFQEVKKLLVETVQKITEIVKSSPSEKVACLNIDWFSY
jgi:uncharacterized protein (TIGR02147 family)